MNKIGIRAHDIGKLSPIDLASLVKKYGFDGVQLVFKKALNLEKPFEHIESVKRAFEGLDIPMLGAYFNPVHPNLDMVEEGVNYFKKHLECASYLGAKFVGTETGSLMGSPWGYLQENHTNETMEKLLLVIKELTNYAEEQNAYIALEGAYAHVAFTPEKVRYILNQINSTHLKVTVDLYNYLNVNNYHKRMVIFEDCFTYLKNDIVIFHLKDFTVKGDMLIQCGLGKGMMDYPTIIKRITEETPNAYLIFEGITGEDILSSVRYIKSLCDQSILFNKSTCK